MKLKWIIVAAVVVLLAGGIVVFEYREVIFPPANKDIVLYGNIDDRQVDVAFIPSERIAEVKVEEGDVVREGDLLATLETVRIRNSIDAAKAAVENARQKYLKAKNGPRQEDIDIARSAVTAAQAALEATGKDYYRQESLAKTNSVAQRIADNAQAKYLVNLAALNASRRQLDSLLAGTRKEDIAAAAAELQQREVDLAIQEQRLKDASLKSPVSGIVRNRLLEPGEMASPQAPVLTIARTDPKWVRTYIPESMLTALKPGDQARIRADGSPPREFEGWIGFIAPNAEFTPKTVETVELRSALVYEVRVFVRDPEGRLKLGAPVTVTFDKTKHEQ